jgi:hypothetical protein
MYYTSGYQLDIKSKQSNRGKLMMVSITNPGVFAAAIVSARSCLRDKYWIEIKVQDVYLP